MVPTPPEISSISVADAPLLTTAPTTARGAIVGSMVVRRTLPCWGIIGSALLLILICVGCNREPVPEPHHQEAAIVFRADRSKLPSDAQKIGKNRDGKVEILLPGVLHDPPIHAYQITRKEARITTPETAAASLFAAFKANDEEWILGSLLPSERADAKALLESKDASHPLRTLFRPLQSVFIWGSAVLDDHAIVFISSSENRDNAHVLVFHHADGLWLLTSELDNNPTLKIAQLSFLGDGEMQQATTS